MEGYVRGGLECQAMEPYPPVQAAGRNPRYAAAMLDNIGGNNSEMTAVAGYFYAHLMTHDCPEAADAFHRISVVEMHHLEIFGELTRQLGEDPRLWGCPQGRKIWWSPGYLQYPRRLGPIIRTAVHWEKGAIRKYRSQLRWIGDPNICENLRRIIADEEAHLRVLATLYDAYVGKSEP